MISVDTTDLRSKNLSDSGSEYHNAIVFTLGGMGQDRGQY